MRPPLKIPLLLAAVFLSLPAAAQVKTGAGSDAAAGTSGQAGSSLNPGGVAPIGGLGGGSLVSPLSLSPSLSPALSAPAISPGQGLAPSALTGSLKPAANAARNDGKPLGAAAFPATPPKTPPGAAAAPAGPPGPPSYFIAAMVKLGVPEALAGRLQAFLAARHPGDQDKIYHGLDHSHEVADLTARILDGQNMPASKKILLILTGALHDVDPQRAENTPARVADTLVHLDNDPEAAALLSDFGARFGFTAAQVKALIMATDFSPDPAQMKAKMDAFAAAVPKAFPDDPQWALDWGKRLAFADQSSTYVGSLEHARERVIGLAVEIRAQLEALGKGPGPSDAVILAGTFKFLDVLRQNPLFALLPPVQAANFDGVKAYFESRQTPEAWANSAAPVPSRAPPSLDLAAARAYIDDVMGGRAPTEREIDALLGDWLDGRRIPRRSERALKVRDALLPSTTGAEAELTAKLKPSLRPHAALLIRLAAEHKVTVAYLESLISAELLDALAGLPEERLEFQLALLLHKDELRRAVARYPEGPGGSLMREIASQMTARSGKSVEEIARDGVFVYADLSGARPVRAYVSRDPDIKSAAVAFYVVREEGKWRIDVYRQNRDTGLSDKSLVDGLKTWLRGSGIPPRDLR